MRMGSSRWRRSRHLRLRSRASFCSTPSRKDMAWPSFAWARWVAWPWNALLLALAVRRLGYPIRPMWRDWMTSPVGKPAPPVSAVGGERDYFLRVRDRGSIRSGQAWSGTSLGAGVWQQIGCRSVGGGGLRSRYRRASGILSFGRGEGVEASAPVCSDIQRRGRG